MRDYLNSGHDIYRESFRIIRVETNLARFPADLEPAVVRMVHAAGDPSIADEIAFSPGVAAAVRAALDGGAPILCDSSMVATGIIRARLPQGNQVVCHIKDQRLAALAQDRRTTKTCAAVDQWAQDGHLDGAVVAIGNAPTALFRLLDVCAAAPARPAAVIGIPVGFVGAAESKEELIQNDLGLDYLTVRGRRGGSAVTVAAINALALRADYPSDREEADVFDSYAEYRVVQEPGSGPMHVWDLPTDEDLLVRLVTDLFENCWADITFGPLVPGAAWEIRAPGAPERVSFSAGYLTVDFGRWHFHLCLGQPTGDPQVVGVRRTAQAWLYRTLDDAGAPRSWGLRLFNGRGDQQMTILLPNPFLTADQKIAERADFQRLATWDRLRETYLGAPPDPLDRSGLGFATR